MGISKVEGAAALLGHLRATRPSLKRAGILAEEANEHFVNDRFALAATWNRAAGIDVVQEVLRGPGELPKIVATDIAQMEALSLQRLRRQATGLPSRSLPGMTVRPPGYRVAAGRFEPVGHFRDGRLRRFVRPEDRAEGETFSEKDVYVTLDHGLGVLRLDPHGTIRSLHVGYLGLSRPEQLELMMQGSFGVYSSLPFVRFVESPLPTSLSFIADDLDGFPRRLSRFLTQPPWSFLSPGRPVPLQVIAPEAEIERVLGLGNEWFFDGVETAVAGLIMGGTELALEFYRLPEGGLTKRRPRGEPRPSSSLFKLGVPA